nr:MAG TPA: hypothetical protein [Bacteriophage sp.]
MFLTINICSDFSFANYYDRIDLSEYITKEK